MNRRLARCAVVAAVAAVAAVCGLAATAHAQDEALNRARASFDKGQDLFVAGKYGEAATEFEAAYQARPFAQFLYNIGACHEKANTYPKAVEYYRRYLAESPKALDKEAVEKRIGVLEKEIEKAKTAPPPDPAQPPPPTAPSAEVQALGDVDIHGVVVIESDPANATIYLDSKKKAPLSRTPWNGSLTGPHTIFVEREGYKPAEQRIAPDPNRLIIMHFELGEEDYLGWVKIEANVPDASIYIDDKSVGVRQKTPWSGNIEPGKHKIWITKEGYTEYATEIDVVRGQTHEVKAQLSGGEVGYVNVRGNVENVRVVLDGKLLCQRGPCRVAVSQGNHTVEIKQKDYKTYKRNFTMQAKTEMTLSPTLAPEPSRVDAYVAYGFAAGFAVGGFLAAGKASSLRDDLQTDIDTGLPPPDEDDGRFNKARIYSVAGDTLYVLGGVSLAAAIYYTFRDKGAPSTAKSDVRAVAVEPHIGPTYAGVGVGVQW